MGPMRFGIFYNNQLESVWQINMLKERSWNNTEGFINLEFPPKQRVMNNSSRAQGGGIWYLKKPQYLHKIKGSIQ